MLRDLVLVDHHETAGIRERKRPEQHGVGHGEDRRVGADADEHCQNGDRGVARVASQGTNRVADVLSHLVGPLTPSHGSLSGLVLRATIAFCEVDISELSNGFLARHRLAHPVLHELGRSHVEVEAHLVIDVAGDRAPRAPGESERV